MMMDFFRNVFLSCHSILSEWLDFLLRRVVAVDGDVEGWGEPFL